ncbi:hypothetical protein [Pseudomonas sp. zbq_11]|uniref:hypothetical protein n=1 Tax=unclassified Pseudomonas TaxID=196821 RepID=UPI00370CA77B
MIRTSKLPASYTPYGVTKLCTNTVVGGAFLLAIGDVIPVLFGKGAKPQIWLQALQSPQSKKFITLVDASIPVHPKMRVEEFDQKIFVKLDGAVVLSLEQTGDDELTVNEIDLRPLGLNLYGNSSGLHAGGVSFKSSTFSNVGTIMAFGAV